MNTKNPEFVYVTYINTSPKKLWEALTDGKFTRQYWFGWVVESAWKVGAPVVFKWDENTPAEARKCGGDGMEGKILACEPPRLLAYTWSGKKTAEADSRVTFLLEPKGEVVKLTVTHDQFQPGSKMYEGISQGWQPILSNLKTLLETGRTFALEK
jgi:uncharacterized protein YndB with AHSA1/START domain